MRGVQQCARIQKELDDSHIRRHAARVQVRHIVERHVAGEQTLQHRLEEATLQFAVPLRRAQAQGGEYRERDLGVTACAPIKFVDQRIGFADSQGECQNDMRPDARQGTFDALGDIVENLRHAAKSWA